MKTAVSDLDLVQPANRPATAWPMIERRFISDSGAFSVIDGISSRKRR